MPSIFTLTRYGRLLLCRAAVAGPVALKRASLLVDTGSNYTVLPVELLEAVGCSPATGADHVRIMTANGLLFLPRVRVNAVSVFDHRVEGAELVAHDLPFSGPIDGLLGMDVLVTLGARIDIPAAQIEIG